MYFLQRVGILSSTPRRGRGGQDRTAEMERQVQVYLPPHGDAQVFVTGPEFMAKKVTFRVVTRGANGEFRITDYPDPEALLKLHTQIGVDDCSTDLTLRGLPVFRGLIGPMPESKGVIRYESPEVFETLTKEWSAAKPARRTRRRTRPPETEPDFDSHALD